jgi:ABC-type sugar transport system ATPase subunit
MILRSDIVNDNVVLEARNVCKFFPGTRALQGVDFELMKGEIHALIGENGAGKSTFIKILTGVYPITSGQIFLEGKEVRIRNPLNAESLGISGVHQNIAYIPAFDVPTNMFMNTTGDKFLTGKYRKTIVKKARESINKLGVKLPLDVPCSRLTPSQLQTMSLARAISRSPRILVADEVTSSLDKDEVKNLFEQLRNLKKKNVSIIYITHHLDEIFELCDRVTVFKDGRKIGTHNIPEVTMEQIVKEMTGKTIRNERLRKPVVTWPGSPVLTVDKLTNYVKDISFDLHHGEILGITGLVGAGKTEIASMLFGVEKPSSGEIKLEGKKCNFESPREAVENGVYLVPEDRLRQGIIPDLSIKNNMTLPVIGRLLGKGGLINARLERSTVGKIVDMLNVKYASLNQNIKFLSGGNQQKVVMGKAIFGDSRLCIFDEPTQGVDIGARKEIYSQITKLAQDGKAVIVCSSDIEEIMTLCDRVIVLRRGEAVAERHISETSKEELAMLCQGIGGVAG